MKNIQLITVFVLFLYGCKRDNEEIPSTTSQSVNQLHNFWYFVSGEYEIGSSNIPINFSPGCFIHLAGDGIAVVGLDGVIGNTTPGCQAYQTTYRELNGAIIIRYDTCSEFSDSLFYINYLSSDSLTLRTRGYRHPGPNVTDSVYAELYFRKNP